jgi:hypothetical protein
MQKDFVDLLQSELAKSHDLGLGPENGGQYATSLFLAVYLDNNPCFMFPIKAPEFRVRQVMGTGVEKDLNGKSTRLFFGFMRNLDKKFCHFTTPPFLM